VPFEIGLQSPPGVRRCAGLVELKAVLAILEPQESLHAVFLVFPIAFPMGGPQLLLGVGDDAHPAGRRIETL